MSPLNIPLKKRIVHQLKKFLAFNRACMFIAISTRVHHWTISWSVRFHLHPHILFLKIVFNIISLLILRLPKYYLRLGFSNQNVICISMGARISPKSGNLLKIMCVKRVTRSKLRTEYEAPPGWLGARHVCVLLMHCWSFRACYISLPT